MGVRWFGQPKERHNLFPPERVKIWASRFVHKRAAWVSNSDYNWSHNDCVRAHETAALNPDWTGNNRVRPDANVRGKANPLIDDSGAVNQFHSD